MIGKLINQQQIKKEGIYMLIDLVKNISKFLSLYPFSANQH